MQDDAKKDENLTCPHCKNKIGLLRCLETQIALLDNRQVVHVLACPHCNSFLGAIKLGFIKQLAVKLAKLYKVRAFTVPVVSAVVLTAFILMYGCLALAVREHILAESWIWNIAGSGRIVILELMLNYLAPVGVCCGAVSLWIHDFHRQIRSLILFCCLTIVLSVICMVVYGYLLFELWYPGFPFGVHVWWLP